MTNQQVRPQVVAHRGASVAHPPGNTLAAFRAAADLGADGVELDVRRAADGSLVVHHDPDLPDGRPIRTVAAGDVPDWVPSLDAALAVCAASGLSVNVEIKNSPVEHDFDEDRSLVDDVLAAVAGWDAADILISSFDPESIAKVRRLDARVPTALLTSDGNTMKRDLEAAASGGHAGLNPWSPHVDESLVHRAHALGLTVNVWTVDDPEEMRVLIGLGVDAIITNVPDVLRALLV